MGMSDDFSDGMIDRLEKREKPLSEKEAKFIEKASKTLYEIMVKVEQRSKKELEDN